MTRNVEELRNAVDTSIEQPMISFKGFQDFYAIDKLMEVKADIGDYDKETKVKYIDVVIVDINPNPSRIYYESKFDDANPASPTCFSDNGLAASTRAENPQAPLCRECQWNQWGSGEGRGKACKEGKKLAVIIPSFDPMKAWQFRVPPTSLAALRNFTKALTTVKVKDHGALPIEVVTRISFSKEKNFGLNFDFVRVLTDSPEDKQLYTTAVAMFEASETVDLVGLNDEPITDAYKPALAAPVQHPQLAPPRMPASEVQAHATRAMEAAQVVDYEEVQTNLSKLPPRRGKR